MKAQFLPLFNVNLSQLQFNSISTKLPLNLISTLFQPQAQMNLNSTSTITSTQYGCDIKATQSCSNFFFLNPSLSWISRHISDQLILPPQVPSCDDKLRGSAVCLGYRSNQSCCDKASPNPLAWLCNKNK